jgi:hypothetical protein
VENCARVSGAIGRPLGLTPVSDGAFRRLAQKIDLELLARFAMADCTGRTGTFDCSAIDWFLERARALGVEHAAPAPLPMGRHLLELGVKPGPRMGELLAEIYDAQLEGTVTTLDEGAVVLTGVVTGEFFPVAGVTWPIGRSIEAADEQLGSPPVVLSDRSWRTRYGADRTIVGRTVELNGVPVTVIGILPADFTGVRPFLSPEVWVPLLQAREVQC